jgi:exosortase E/protease (VPEID-CTERM system)
LAEIDPAPATQAAPAVRPTLRRSGTLLVVLALEISALWLAFPVEPVHGAVHAVSVLLGSFGHTRQFLILFLAGALFFSGTTIRTEIQRFDSEPQRPWGSSRWLHVHLAALALFASLGMVGSHVGSLTSTVGRSWALLFASAGAAFLLSWLFCLLPPGFWLEWVRSSPVAMVAGVCAGLAGSLAAVAARHWFLLSYWTLLIVERLLRLLGQPVVKDLSTLTVGTPRFQVILTDACSGLEGIGIVSIFLVAYLWGCRRDLRFPPALLLLPIGMATVWLANAVRVTAMVLIGGVNPRMASEGFHSMAGWLSLNFVALGIVLASRRLPFFTRIPENEKVGPSDPAGVFLLPLLAILVTAFITRLGFDGFDRLYPLRVMAAALVLWAFRSEVARFTWRPSLWSLAIGVLVFLTWIGIAFVNGSIHRDLLFARGLGLLSPFAAGMWLTFRVLGAVITVPLAEELAFRGYLLRKLISSDFRAVAFDRFTWLSFLGSSVIFGALHGQWVAGIVAGMLFALAARRRGQFSDAVYAHGVANALLAVFVLVTRNWSLWT